MPVPANIIRFSMAMRRVAGIAALGTILSLLSPLAPARAQLLDQLKGAVGAGGGGAPAATGLPSVNQAPPSNIAGVLQYCIRNNYLSGAAATSAKNSIVSKFTGSGQSSRDSEFKSGNDGVLQTGNGNSFGLGGEGIKGQVTQKICGMVLQRAKALL